MKATQPHDQEINNFLKTYPDVIPSSSQINRMTIAVKRKLVGEGDSKPGWIDLIFGLLFIPALLALTLGNQLIDGWVAVFWHDTQLVPGVNPIHLLIAVIIIVTTPLILVILPLNDRR